MTVAGRRPLNSRDSAWARALAGALARAGATPNAISVASVLFAAIAAAALVWPATAPGMRATLLVAAAVGIQLRLVCNLLDGMVAIEGGRRTAVGDLYNEIPDRIADPLLLIAAGYAAVGIPAALPLGTAAALGALFTAYVRALGASLGAGQCFHGPMAKPQRMAVLTVACLLAAIAAPLAGRDREVLVVALAIIVIGCVVTVARRILAIARHLRAQPVAGKEAP